LAWNDWVSWDGIEYPFIPMASRTKWLEPHHMVSITDRYARDKTDSLQHAFFNGQGYASLENLWGHWYGTSDHDAETIRRITSIERAFASNAHLRHQAAGAVVDAGVDHLAVARGGLGADAFGCLQHDHFAAGLGQPPRDRKADHPGSNDDAIYLVHVRFKSGNLARVEVVAAFRLLSFRSGVMPEQPLGLSRHTPLASPR
jgi:hypothetical protein